MDTMRGPTTFIEKKPNSVMSSRMKVVFLSLLVFMPLMYGCSNNGSDSRVPEKKESPSALTPEERERLKDIGKRLQEAKALLSEEGKYDCCIKQKCDYCALNTSECYCYRNLKATLHVCFECYDGWQKGNGVDPSIKKEEVKPQVRMRMISCLRS